MFFAGKSSCANQGAPNAAWKLLPQTQCFRRSKNANTSLRVHRRNVIYITTEIHAYTNIAKLKSRDDIDAVATWLSGKTGDATTKGTFCLQTR